MTHQAVGDYWNLPVRRGTVLTADATVTLVIDDSLPPARRVLHFGAPDGPPYLALRPEVAATAGIEPGWGVERALAALEAAGERFHDWEQVFYLPQEERVALATAPADPDIRELAADDAAAFAAFEAENSQAEIDEAFVELDHWLVVGAIDPDTGRLVGVSSVYPWDGTMLADIGILVAPSHRGRGLAARLVRAAAAATLARGYEPQYRCQVSNTASRATGQRAGFHLFGTWRVVTGEDPADAGGAVH